MQKKAIKCDVTSCKHNNDNDGCCELEEIKISCTCNNNCCQIKEETICQNFKKAK